MPKQSTQFYRKNEARKMKEIGLDPTKNSGSGWIEKADGQSEMLICELKSTEKKSIGVKFADIAKLEEQAIVAGKIPIFAINDLTNDDLFIIIRPEHISSVAKYLKTGKNDTAATFDTVTTYVEKTVTREKRKIGAPSEEDYKANRYKGKEKTAY